MLNSQNIESGADAWRDSFEVTRWLAEQPLPHVGRLSESDFQVMIELRRLVRGHLQSEGGEELTAFARSFPLHLTFGSRPGFSHEESSTAGFITDILVAVFDAQRDGTWLRLKACAECEWVIFDRSRNHSVTWCSEQACGTRHRARSYRQRVRARGPIAD